MNIEYEYEYHSKVKINPIFMGFFIIYSEISIIQNIKF